MRRCQPFWRLRLCCLLLVMSSVSTWGLSGSQAVVTSGRDLALALADDGVEVIWLEQDIYMIESDWVGLGPFPLGRATNVTITSANYHTMDLGFIQSKVGIGCRNTWA